MKRKYDENTIVNIINNQYPDFKIDTIKYLGSGFDGEAYLINNEYVFKFPMHQFASDNLYKEIIVLLELNNRFTLEIPRPDFFGQPTEMFDKYFVGYKMIKGNILTAKLFQNFSKETKDNLARDLALFLKELHSIKSLDIDIDVELNMKEKYEEDYSKVKEILYPMLNEIEKEKVDKMYSDILNNELFLNYERGLVHCDLGSVHMVVDENNKLCGIIDFGDVCFTDTDYDFMYFLIGYGADLGREFGLKVLEYYNHPNIDDVLMKADIYKNIYWPFEELLFGKEYGLDEWFNRGLESIKSQLNK